MKIVNRNKYLQLGKISNGRFYPPRIFPIEFRERWSNPKNNCKLKFKKPSIVDMMVERKKPCLKRKYAGMIYSKRGRKFWMGKYSRKDLDFHRTR